MQPEHLVAVTLDMHQSAVLAVAHEMVVPILSSMGHIYTDNKYDPTHAGKKPIYQEQGKNMERSGEAGQVKGCKGA